MGKNGTSERSVAVDRPTKISSEADLDAFVSASNVALVEFYTEGCGICQSMDPVLGNLARELDAAIGLINPRDDPPLIERFDVRSVPLFVLFVNGSPVARRADGFIGGGELSAWISKNSTVSATDQ